MQGLTVAMVGDVINGMAIGVGTDVANIVLMKSSLEDVVTAIDLSWNTLSRIRMNYVWAVGYNILVDDITNIRPGQWSSGYDGI
jgi:P-type Cu+ transporter